MRLISKMSTTGTHFFMPFRKSRSLPYCRTSVLFLKIVRGNNLSACVRKWQRRLLIEPWDFLLCMSHSERLECYHSILFSPFHCHWCKVKENRPQWHYSVNIYFVCVSSPFWVTRCIHLTYVFFSHGRIFGSWKIWHFSKLYFTKPKRYFNTFTGNTNISSISL